MVLGKLSVPGRPTNFDFSRARAYCACSRCGWGLFGHFFSRLSLLSSFSVSLGDDPIYTEILPERAVKPKTTNQLLNSNLYGPIHAIALRYINVTCKCSQTPYGK